MILLDTHVVVWLYAGEVDRLPVRVAELIEEAELRISPAVQLELAYLQEVGRITPAPAEIIGDLALRLSLVVDPIDFAPLCAAAVDFPWTRDPFDRLQVAHSKVRDVPLVTKDTRIRDHWDLAVWE